MPRHSEQFVLSSTPGAAMAQCRLVIGQIGWEVRSTSADSIKFKERGAATSFTWAAEITLTVRADESGSSQITMDGSIAGFGPIQSNHLKGEMGRVRNLVETMASAPEQGQPSHSLAGEIERLVQLRTSGVLTDAEFEDAKRRTLEGQ